MLGLLACSRALCVYVLACSRAWHVCVLTCYACLRASVFVVLACVRVCYDEMFYFLTCLRTWCAFLSYLLYISILFFNTNLKILTSKNLCALLSWTYFLFTFWHQLIKLFKTNLREAGKSMDLSYSCSCSKAVSISYNLYIRQKKSSFFFKRWGHNWNTSTLIFLPKMRYVFP